MKTETTDRDALQRDCREIRLMTAREALRLEPRRIEVPESAELLLSPTNPEYAGVFARVRLKSHEDLQTLGLVPRRLSEEKVRQAIAADDADVYQLAGNILRQSSMECHCSNGSSRSSTLRGNPLRGVYNSIRKRHNPALARALSDHYSTHISWDSPLPAIVRRWAEHLRTGPEITVAVLDDIIIHRNATLAVFATLNGLMAWNIWIHSTGRLIQRCSYLKTWANSINRFNDFLDPVIVAEAHKVAPLWKLSE